MSQGRGNETIISSQRQFQWSNLRREVSAIVFVERLDGYNPGPATLRVTMSPPSRAGRS